MRYLMIGALFVSMLVAPSSLLGQYNAYSQVPEPRVRRYWREQAVTHAGGGPQARLFVETHGEFATTALLSCSPPVAKKLVAFSQGNSLNRLGTPRELLLAIGQPGNGDEVCLFIIDHAEELCDPAARHAFLTCPLEYALYLKPLAEGAVTVRTARLRSEASGAAWLSRLSVNSRIIAVAGGAVLLALLVRWRRAHRV